MKVIIFTFLALHLASCSSLNKMAIKASTKVLKVGGESFYEESDYEIFEKSIFANIKTMESLYHFDKNQILLNELLIKSYAALAYGLYETRLLEARLSKSHDEDEALFRVKQVYSRAIAYGEEYIRRKGVNLDSFYKIKNTKELGEKFNANDKVALFYFAQSLAGLLAADLSNMQLVVKAASVQVIIDWVCKDEPDFEHGACAIFDAAYDAIKPRMLGGNIEKAKLKFQHLMEKYPQNLFIALNYIEYILIPLFEEEEYSKVLLSLQSEVELWQQSLLYLQTGAKVENYKKHKEFNLFNAIARKRMQILMKYKTNVF